MRNQVQRLGYWARLAIIVLMTGAIVLNSAGHRYPLSTL
jgi:hypothetical protein